MWILFAFGSAFFAGITAILAKCGIRKTDSTVATAIRTVIVLIFAWMMVFVVGTQSQLSEIEGKTILFLVLSGLATGASWLCYFKALQLGDVNKVVPIDKSSTILTILLAFLFLKEEISIYSGVAIVLIAAGTFLMIEKKEQKGEGAEGKSWLLYAVGSAVFASLTSILGKVGISGIDSNLGTAIRTGVVLVMAWLMVFVTGKQKELKHIPFRELLFICLSGIATGGSWMCYYKALQDGLASVVVPIDKMSILVTIAFSWLVFHERLSKKSALGLAAIVTGTVVMMIPTLIPDKPVSEHTVIDDGHAVIDDGHTATDAEYAVIDAGYAEEELLSRYDSVEEFIDDESEYKVQVIFSTDKPVKNFKFLELGYTESDEDGEIQLNAEQELYVMEELSPQTPLVVSMAFEGIIPTRGISYTDKDGTEKCYAVEMSGKDGALILTEITE